MDIRIRWKALIWCLFHRKQLTRADRDVLTNLASYASTGVAWPSHATLANRARVNARTVARALTVGRGMGLVEWREGGRWIVNGRWRCRTNRYRLIMPILPAVEISRPTPYGQIARGLLRKLFRKKETFHQLVVPEEPIAAVKAAQEALRSLAERRAADIRQQLTVPQVGRRRP